MTDRQQGTETDAAELAAIIDNFEMKMHRAGVAVLSIGVPVSVRMLCQMSMAFDTTYEGKVPTIKRAGIIIKDEAIK